MVLFPASSKSSLTTIPAGQVSAHAMGTVGNTFTAQYDGQVFLRARSSNSSTYGYIGCNITYPNCNTYLMESSWQGTFNDYTVAFFVTKGTEVKTVSVTNLQNAKIEFIAIQ